MSARNSLNLRRNCVLQRHLVDSRSDEGSSGCRNVNRNNYKGCILRNFS